MLSPPVSAACHNSVISPCICHNSRSKHEELGDGAVKVVLFFFLYNPHFLSPACPPNPLACVGDITWLLAPSSHPPATVINSVNKWIMTGRLAGSHHWPWVLLEWPFFGLTKKPFWYHCWKYTRNDGLSAGGGKAEHYTWGRGRRGCCRNHQCRVNLYFASTAASWILN